MKRIFLSSTLVAACMIPAAAYSTDGYFSHGYGMKAKGMAGATTAMAIDSFGGATNPASMVWVGERLDLGMDWFSPKRSAERTGSGAAGIQGSATSDSTSFFVPEFGYNKMLSPNLSLGVSVYGNGGMNTNYPGGQLTGAGAVGTCTGFRLGTSAAVTTQTSFNLLCGDGRLGVNLEQLVIAPTLAYKFSPNHSIGVSPLFGYQRFKAEGLQGFTGFSSAPDKLTNNGNDTARGWGGRIGYMGKITDSVTLGAAYSTKIQMSKFGKYAGLFAEQGDFDMPANYSVGIAFKATPKMTVAVDYKRILYGGVRSVANSSTFSVAGGAGIPNSLGVNNGRGFGWRDIGVFKLGIEYQQSDALTLRAGYGRSDNPIGSQDVTFNILAPGVVQDHYTLGMTYGITKQSEITAAFMIAPRKSVTGPSLFNQFGVPNSNEKIELRETSLGVAWGMKF